MPAALAWAANAPGEAPLKATQSRSGGFFLILAIMLAKSWELGATVSHRPL